MIRNSIDVAVGNNRGNGANLGAWNLNANNGLANSNGNNWRSRLSLIENTSFRSEPETPHVAVGLWLKSHGAVKEVLERSVSRPLCGSNRDSTKRERMAA